MCKQQRAALENLSDWSHLTKYASTIDMKQIIFFRYDVRCFSQGGKSRRQSEENEGIIIASR